MTTEEITQRIDEICETFGMKGNKAADIIGITHQAFRNKKHPNAVRDKFNKDNLNKLIEYIKSEADKLQTIS